MSQPTFEQLVELQNALLECPSCGGENVRFKITCVEWHTMGLGLYIQHSGQNDEVGSIDPEIDDEKIDSVVAELDLMGLDEDCKPHVNKVQIECTCGRAWNSIQAFVEEHTYKLGIKFQIEAGGEYA